LGADGFGLARAEPPACSQAAKTRTRLCRFWARTGLEARSRGRGAVRAKAGVAAMTIYKFAVGVVLALAMIAVLGLAALVFSARDFQFGVAQISPATNGLISFQRLVEADRQIQQLQTESAGPRGEQLQVQQRIAALDNQSQAAETSINESRAQIVGSIADIE